MTVTEEYLHLRSQTVMICKKHEKTWLYLLSTAEGQRGTEQTGKPCVTVPSRSGKKNHLASMLCCHRLSSGASEKTCYRSYFCSFIVCNKIK